MWWPTSLAFTLLLLYPLPVFAPFPPAPHRNGWHPDKPGMRMPWTQPPPPKKPPPYKKILPHGTKCIRPNVIGAEEQETTLMIELLDGYPACFSGCLIHEQLEGCPYEDFCLMERKGPWYWEFTKCINRDCLKGKHHLERHQRKYQRLWWERKYCPYGYSEDPPFGDIEQFDWRDEDYKNDQESRIYRLAELEDP